MHEIGGHESHGGHGDNKLVVPVSVTMSILAVLVAAATLMGHRAHTEELLLQAKASDQWSYYQAKNSRLFASQVMVDTASTFQAKNEEKAELVREKYAKQAERYEGEKDGINEEAKKLEQERDLLKKRADHFDAGEGILEIGLIICSLTLLANKKLFWFGGIAIGAIGLVVTLFGFFTHG
jgi:hypothetical protein